MIKNYLGNIKLVDRVSYIRELCKNCRVLHLGATDAPDTKDSFSNGRWLHSYLEQDASHLVGMDINIEMIQWLSDQGIKNIKYGNIENVEEYPQEEFDVVIAGEILEHLSNPGRALDSLRQIMSPSTKLVITVPNAYSFKGFCRALLKYELIHPDHTLHHSPYTLKALLERHKFHVDSYFSFVNGGTGGLAGAANLFLQFNPQLAEGIGFVCSSTEVKAVL